ncbi:MAG: Na/Pi cotransporter family protein, partial [Tissierellia bacterium]|nr:Na/Pi cotransporter family protein [Tissierellia bacterium]
MNIIIPTIGGLGLFLYGMTTMGDALQKAAGEKLKRFIQVFTGNIFLGVLVGALVTMVIQSSSATTVMVVGFVNAGLMNLPQATGVIMGANVGTTITAQIIAFDVMEYVPLLLGISVFTYLFSKKEKVKEVTMIFIGLGILFTGMEFMKNGLAPLGELQAFQDLLVSLNNPVLGLLVGLGITTLVQSSSASIGILQALSHQGLTIGMAIPILCGDNIGTTTTALISSIGANKTAKRAAVIHFLFNLIGTLLFMFVLRFPVQEFVYNLTPDNPSRMIANSHTLFNLINVVVQLPFYKLLVKAAERLVPGDVEEEEKESKYLDKRFMDTPFAALNQVKMEIHWMIEVVSNSLKDARAALIEGKYDRISHGLQSEQTTNSLQREITEYLTDLSKEAISTDEREMMSVYLNVVSNIERIGDHAENILEMAEKRRDSSTSFSEDGLVELDLMFEKVFKAYEATAISFDTDSEETAR